MALERKKKKLQKEFTPFQMMWHLNYYMELAISEETTDIGLSYIVTKEIRLNVCR